jgi:preprotein translocase subunit SecG
MATLLMVVLMLTTAFLIVLILIQRGKGGGLAGAFGGMGGQSAFGTKAGDLFTRITIVVAAVWIILCIVMVKVLGLGAKSALSEGLGGAAESKAGATAPLSPGKQPASPEKQSDAAPAAPAKMPGNEKSK